MDFRGYTLIEGFHCTLNVLLQYYYYFMTLQDERLNSGKRAVRLDSCFLRCCPKRRRANRRLVNIEDFVSVNHDDNMNSDLVASSNVNSEEGDKGHSESDVLLDSSKVDSTKYYGIDS